MQKKTKTKKHGRSAQQPKSPAAMPESGGRNPPTWARCFHGRCNCGEGAKNRGTDTRHSMIASAQQPKSPAAMPESGGRNPPTWARCFHGRRRSQNRGEQTHRHSTIVSAQQPKSPAATPESGGRNPPTWARCFHGRRRCRNRGEQTHRHSTISAQQPKSPAATPESGGRNPPTWSRCFHGRRRCRNNSGIDTGTRLLLLLNSPSHQQQRQRAVAGIHQHGLGAFTAGWKAMAKVQKTDGNRHTGT